MKFVQKHSDQNYARNLEVGNKFERKMEQFFLDEVGYVINGYMTAEEQYRIGENDRGIEFKNDREMKYSNNVCFEFKEKSRGSDVGYRSSGLRTIDNSTIFCIGDEFKVFLFDKTFIYDWIWERVIKEGRYEFKKPIPSFRDEEKAGFMKWYHSDTSEGWNVSVNTIRRYNLPLIELDMTRTTTDEEKVKLLDILPK